MKERRVPLSIAINLNNNTVDKDVCERWNIQDGPKLGILYTIHCIPTFGPPCIKYYNTYEHM